MFAGRPVQTDVSPGAWIADAVGTSLTDVASHVPPVFAAYARVLHPPLRYDGDDDVEITWAEVAVANGRTAHPAMQWPAITGSWDYLFEDDQPGLWNAAPAEGHLPATVATRLAAVLARHTRTPDDCFFAIWSGFGCVTSDAPVLVLPHREFWLVRGPVGLAAANLAAEPAEQSANLWWPADRAWLVATDIDLTSSYVGGSAAAVAELRATPGLEVAEVAPGDRTTRDADTLNPLPADG